MLRLPPVVSAVLPSSPPPDIAAALAAGYLPHMEDMLRQLSRDSWEELEVGSTGAQDLASQGYGRKRVARH